MVKRETERPTPAELNAAAHLSRYRDAEGASYEQLAAEFTRRGAPAGRASLQRTVKGERRMRLGEANALALTLGVSLEQLVMPPEVADSVEVRRLFEEWQAAERKFESARADANNKLEELAEYVTSLPSSEPARDVIEKWVAGHARDRRNPALPPD